MIAYAETVCAQRGPMQQFELLTGRKNLAAQAVYRKSGYVADDRLHMSK